MTRNWGLLNERWRAEIGWSPVWSDSQKRDEDPGGIRAATYGTREGVRAMIPGKGATISGKGDYPL
jgi:hypothetical protein